MKIFWKADNMYANNIAAMAPAMPASTPRGSHFFMNWYRLSGTAEDISLDKPNTNLSSLCLFFLTLIYNSALIEYAICGIYDLTPWCFWNWLFIFFNLTLIFIHAI